MKIIVIPDSFKGTLTAAEVCDIISAAIRDRDPSAEVITIPMADGGEGTCDAFRYALGGDMILCPVHGPFMQMQDARYWRREETAVIELASAAGFIADPAKRDPASATSFGVGELIRHAAEAGCRRIILGLGGSCTNDAGIGIAAGLGARFFDGSGREFIPTGGTIEDIRQMDLSMLRRTIRGIRFEVMCDVDNPLYGKQGAAYVYAPQKGADTAMVRDLDRNLRYFAQLIRERLGVDVSDIPGSGAAGGAGAGAIAFLNAGLKPGAQIVLEMNHFDELLRSADLVITGEGQLDEQSLRGKAVMTVAEAAKTRRVPVIAVVGNTKGDIEQACQYGIKKVIRTIDFCHDPGQYKASCRQDLYRAVKEMEF